MLLDRSLHRINRWFSFQIGLLSLDWLLTAGLTVVEFFSNVDILLVGFSFEFITRKNQLVVSAADFPFSLVSLQICFDSQLLPLLSCIKSFACQLSLLELCCFLSFAFKFSFLAQIQKLDTVLDDALFDFEV